MEVKFATIDNRHNEYQGYLSKGWAKAMLESADVGDVALKSAAFDLVAAWRGVDHAGMFPFLMAEQLAWFAAGYTTGTDPSQRVLRLGRMIADRLRERVPEFTSDRRIQAKFTAELERISAELHNAEPSEVAPFSVEDVWKEYCEEWRFKFAIAHAMRMCYVSGFNAYDDFVRQCAGIGLNDPEIRTSDRNFRKRVAAVFGADVLQRCWSGSEIRPLRLARHALSHAGGRETAELQKLQHSFRVQDGELQIWPDDIKRMLRTLEPKAIELCEAVKKGLGARNGNGA